MEPNQTKPRSSAKDFFLNLGATVALYTTVGSLINLLFSVINSAYPQITNGYNYSGTASISWPVAILVIFFPIFILLMWVLNKQYAVEPPSTIHKWLTYITLFIAGLLMAGDLITVLYYFIDGQELTVGFLLKILFLLIIAGGVFTYYISDIRGKLTPTSRNAWRIFALIVVLGSIVWGFSVLGSPRTQRLYKYDETKVNDLQNINQYIISYYQAHDGLPGQLSDLAGENNYYPIPTDLQSGKSYEYKLIGQSAKAYELCAEFNKASTEVNGRPQSQMYPIYAATSWVHPAGHHCFSQTINVNMYPPVKLPM